MEAVKYRLKKWYPSLPKEIHEGDTVIKNKTGYAKKCNKFYLLSSWTIKKKEVENNPEFWERIEERDYKIIACTNEEGIIFNKRRYHHLLAAEDIALYSDEGTWIDPYNLHGEEKIHSVKRLSDGEVFTIGDKIGHKTAKYNVLVNEIDYGRRYKDGLYLFDRSNRNISLRNAYHIEPLFTTDDGVDIYEGDKYWIVNQKWNIKSSHGGNKLIGIICRAKLSSEEEAQRYINNHKPKYSKADIRETISNFSTGHHYSDLLIYHLDN